MKTKLHVALMVMVVMMLTSELVARAFCAGLRPEPEITVSEWADEFRIIGKPSPEPGKWRTNRVPYAREIMDRLSPSDPAQIVVLMAAAQGAKSEIGINAVGCWIDRYPDFGMIVMPTTTTAKRFVRTRLDPFIEINPRLRGNVAKQRSRGQSNTAQLKDFAGGQMVIVGANSGADVRSYPARYAWMDEVDGYPADLDREGDPTELVIQRTASFRNRKILMTSTPTLEAVSLIAKWFKKGDQRHYFVPCPLCNHYQVLIWGADRAREGRLGGIRWPKGEPNLARYECEACGGLWEEWRKTEVLKRGMWEAAAPQNYRDGEGETPCRSYQINSLYYPHGWPENAWPNLAAKWEYDHRDPIKLKTFVNLKLGEPYADPAEAKAEPESLFARREVYGPEIPAGACALTAGVDVQADRLEAELVAWGPDEESWGVEYRVFPGDTSKLVGVNGRKSPWETLDEWLVSEYLSELGIPLQVKAACIDSGYNRQAVTQFCGERTSRRVWAIIGRAGQHPIWSTKAKRQRGKWPPAQVIGVDAVKERVYASLRIAEPGPSYCHFPATEMHSKHYFEMLCSEVRLPDYTGPIPKFEWRKRSTNSRNEALDARGYAYAALVGLQMQYGFKLGAEMEAVLRMAAAAAAPPPKAVAQPAREAAEAGWISPGRGGWFS